MEFRHEVKHEISPQDMPALRQRLRAVMSPDSHAPEGRYQVRSLYFDNLEDKALREKLDGVKVREKYRIRLYNHDPSLIHLERKQKLGALGRKTFVPLTPRQAQSMAGGSMDWMAASPDPLLLGFYARLRQEGLRPKVLVDYTREAFVFAPGNVRVTLDYHIRTGLHSARLLDPHCPTVPIPGSPCILEVKWDAFLPDLVRDLVQLDGRHSCAFSKYAACRMFD